MQKYYIYKIECLANGRVYIGQTQNFQKREREHLNDLKRNQHHSILLQRAFNKYGERAFKCSIIEECTKANVDEREKYWINYYDSTNKYKGFNLEGGGNAKKIIAPITRQKHRENARRNYYAIHYKCLNSPEAREKKSKKFSGKNNPCFGKTPREWMDEAVYKKWVEDKSRRLKLNNPMKNGHTEESKQKISIAMKGEKNPFYGKHHTNEVKQYLSEIRTGAKNPNAVKVKCLNNNKVYSTITQAAKELKVDGSAISKVCRGKQNHTNGYKFQYV